ncbi:MAG: DUF481 domain-containing protein [Lysobacterales bacterium]
MSSSLPRAILLLAALLFSQAGLCAKTDIVYLKNGDRVTGEVKGLDRGKLEFSTDHMGTVYIEWEDIEQIVSDTGQAVELTNGQRFYGPLDKPDNSEMVVVNTDQGKVGLSIGDVVSMYPVESGFWDRLDVSASLGFSWDKGSQVGKYNLGVDAIYRNPRFVTRASFSNEVTTQEGRDDTARSNVDANHMAFHADKTFHVFFGNMERNDQLGLDLRVLAGAGYGTMPIRTQRNWIALAAGLAVDHEIPSTGQEETNLEGVGMVYFDYFKYSDPERTLTSALQVFPGLTDWGRWRATFNTDFRLELVSDLFWKLSFYASYDSDPVSADAATNDYGATSSLAYKF